MNKLKVPINAGWISEHGLLNKALSILGIAPYQVRTKGIFLTEHYGDPDIAWEDHLMFTVAQLLELGFEPGEFVYCPHCKRIQVDCDREMDEIAARREADAAYEKGELSL